MNNLEEDLKATFRKAAQHVSPSFLFEEVWAKNRQDSMPVGKQLRAPKWVGRSVASLAGIAAVAFIIIAVPFGRTGLSLGDPHNKTIVTSTQIDTAISKGQKIFQTKHPHIEFGTSFRPSTKLFSVRLVVFSKISKQTAEALLHQLLTDISTSVPGHSVSSEELLQDVNLHFEFADAKDRIDPLFYGDKSVTSRQIQWNSAAPAHRPVLNIQQPVIPGTTAKVHGWITDGVRDISIQTGTSADSCVTQDNGYFSCKIDIPDNLARGTTAIKVFVNKQVVLTKTVSVANAYDPLYRIEAERAIMNQYEVNIKQLRISQVKHLQNNQWFLNYKVQKHGRWLPSFGTYGITVTKQSNGQYKTKFANYG